MFVKQSINHEETNFFVSENFQNPSFSLIKANECIEPRKFETSLNFVSQAICEDTDECIFISYYMRGYLRLLMNEKLQDEEQIDTPKIERNVKLAILDFKKARSIINKTIKLVQNCVFLVVHNNKNSNKYFEQQQLYLSMFVQRINQLIGLKKSEIPKNKLENLIKEHTGMRD